MRVSRCGAVVAVALLSLGVSSCSKSSNSSTSTTLSSGSGTTVAGAPTTAASAPNTITIHNFAFHPSPLRVKAGTTVTVTNTDGTDHSLTANDGSFDTGVFSSGSKTIALNKAGTYSIHCRIHSFMTGQIIVTS